MIDFSDIYNQVTKAQFISNGELVAMADKKNIVVRQTNSLEFTELASLPFHASDLANFVFAPDGEHYLVRSNKDSSVDVYSNKGEKIASIVDALGGVENAIWSPDSTQVLVFSSNQIRLTIYNLCDGSKVYIRHPKYPNKGFAFSNNGAFFGLIERHNSKDSIGLYFTKDWTAINHFQIESIDLCDLMWAPNGSFIVAWDTCLYYKLIPICPLMGPIKMIEPYTAALGIKTVSYSHNSLLLAVGSFDEKIRLFNGLTWETICQVEYRPQIVKRTDVKCWKQEEVRQGNRTVSEFVEVQSETFKVQTIKVVYSETNLSPPKEGVGILEFSHDDSFIAFRNDNMPNTVWILELRHLDICCIINFVKPVKSFKWSPKQNVLCIVNGTNRLHFWSETERSMSICDLPLVNAVEIQKIKWNEAGTHFLMYEKNSVCLSLFKSHLDS